MNNRFTRIVKKITSSLLPAQMGSRITVYSNTPAKTKQVTATGFSVDGNKNNLPVKKYVVPGIASFFFIKYKQCQQAKTMNYDTAQPVPAYAATAHDLTAKKMNLRKTFSKYRVFTIALLMLNLFFVSAAFGQTTYYSIANGNWNVNTTWSLTSGGVAVGSGVFPVAGDIVNIEGGFNVTIPASTSAACATLNITSANAGNGTLTFTSTSSLTVSADITVGTAGSAKAGTVNMTSGGTLTCNGNLTIGSGTVASALNQGTGSNVAVDGAATILQPSAALVNLWAIGAGTATVTGLFTMDGAGVTTTWDGTLSISTGTFNANGGILVNGATALTKNITFTNNGKLNVGGNGISGAAGATFTRSTGTVNYNAAGDQPNVAGYNYQNLTISGNGTKTLLALADVNAILTVTAGTIFNLSTSNITTTGVVLECGAAAGSSITGTGALTIGTSDLTVNDAAGAGSSGATISTPVVLGTNVIFTVADDGSSAADLAVSGIISGSSTLTKSGAGTLVLSNANTYTGTTTISAGTLQYGISNAIAAGAVTVNGGTLDIGTFDDNVGAVTLTSGTIAGTTGVLTGTSYTVSSGSVTAILGGSGALSKTTAGAVTMSGVNTYTGITTITAGVLSVSTIGDGGVAGNLGQATNAATNLVLNGGTLQYTGATASTDRNFTLTAGNISTIDITNAANTLTITGASTGTTGGLTKIGSGTLTLSGNNLHTGATTVTAGTLKLGAAERIANTSALVVNGTFDMNGFSESVASLAGAGTVTSSAGGTLTLTLNGATATTFSGIIENGSATAVSLVKSGTSILTLSGNNSYSGTGASTTINSGSTIRLGAANVLPDNTAMILNLGTLSTGASAGFSETIGTLDFSGAGTSTIALGTGVHTLTIANSSSNTWAGTTLSITGWTGAGYPVITATAGKIMVGVGGLTPAQLAKINFTGFASGAQITASGELVPLVTTYYSNGDNAPNLVGSWKTNRDGTGTSPANFTSGNIFIIQGSGNGGTTPHSMTTTANWTVSGANSVVIIENGATLTASNTFTLAATSFFQIDNGGSYVQNIAASMGTTTFIGTEIFGATSNFTYNFAPSGTSAPSSPGYGNLTINTSTNGANFGWAGTVSQVQGNLNILSTGTGTIRHALTAAPNIAVSVGGNFTLSGTNTNFWLSSGAGTCALTVGGDVSISGSALLDLANSTGAGTLNIGGSFSQTGGTFTSNSAVSTVAFTGTGKTFTQSAGTLTSTNINWVVNNGASLTLINNLPVATTRTVAVNGTLDCSTLAITGAGTAVVNNGGIIKLGSTSASGAVAGNITATGGLTLNTGSTVEFNGTGAQFVSARTFSNLNINNSNGVTLLDDVIANNTLTLSSGILNGATNAKTVTVTNTSASAVSAGSSTRFVEGPLNWSLGTGTYIFPVGRGTGNYFPFTLALSAASSPVVTVEAFNSDAGVGATFDGTLGSISHTEYWKATLNSGTFTGKVSLTRVNALTTEDVIAKSTLQGGTYTSIGGTAASPSINNSNDISSFSYFVMATTLTNCPTSTAVAPSTDQEVCQGVATNELTATITNSGGPGTPTLQYQWYYNTTNSNTVAGATLISGATSQTYTPLSGAPEVGTRYYFCVGYAADNGCGQTNATQSLASNTVKVTVNGSLPVSVTIAAAPGNTICAGTSVTFTATPTNGGGAPTYQWYNGATPISGETGVTYTSSTLVNGDAISVQLTSNATCATGSPATSNTITMTVNAIPTTPTITPAGPTTFCAGGSVLLSSSSASGNQWYKDNVLMSGETSQTYTATTSGSYTVVVTENGCPSLPSAATVVTVNAIPATPTITPGGPTTFCAGGSVLLTSSAATGNQWYKDNVLISGETGQTYSATTSGSYTVVVTENGCPSLPSAATVVTVNPIPATPTITPGGPTTFCAGGSVLLTSSAATGNQWYKDNVLISGETNQTYTATTSGSYTVVVTENGCPSLPSAATVVTVNPNLPVSVTIAAAPGNTICAGTSVTFTATPTNGGGAPTYQWYNGATPISGETGVTYTSSTLVNGDAISVQLTSNATCATGSPATSNTITMTVNAIPATATITPVGPTTFCAGGSVLLTSSAATGNQWYKDNVLISGETSQTYTATTSGSYTVVVTENGCPSLPSAATVVTVNAIPATATITLAARRHSVPEVRYC
ncbi:MAG: autotransporter-associated beta strand repeat-containing protein [Chitinophagaceae bacterium]|nr:autotransporter-associated beta strand repeat-containing protein [Chitinophagaceae bacterium]